MDFLKKNYEKILLALVLLGLTAAVVGLTIYIPHERDKLSNYTSEVTKTRAQPLPPPDTAALEAALQRLQSPFSVDLTTKHRVFNPVIWQINPDGGLRKIESETNFGIRALKVINIDPIYLTVTYVTNGATGYEIKEKDDSQARPFERHSVIHADTSPSDRYLLRKVEGPAENPTALDLEFKDATHENIKLSTDPAKPFKRVTAYSADLRYPPDPAAPKWDGRRIGATLRVEGVDYKVIDVQSNCVIVSDPTKRTHYTFFLSRPSE